MGLSLDSKSTKDASKNNSKSGGSVEGEDEFDKKKKSNKRSKESSDANFKQMSIQLEMDE